MHEGEMKLWCLRPLLCTLLRLNWAMHEGEEKLHHRSNFPAALELNWNFLFGTAQHAVDKKRQHIRHMTELPQDLFCLFVGVLRLFVTVTDISRPCQPEKLIPLLP